MNIKPSSKPKPRKKKSSRQLIKLELDKIVKEIVLERDGKCVCSAPAKGHWGARQPGHLITRGKEGIRWDLRNVNEQCQSCNGRHEHFSHYYTDWFVTKFGVLSYHALCQDGERVQKLQQYELEELLDQLKKIRQKQLVASLSGETFIPRFTQAEILSGAWAK